MSAGFCLSLKARQRLFVNGAVLRFDRKVRVELLNDAVFLLENHVLQPEAITSPLKELYFTAQTLLMEPESRPYNEVLFRSQLSLLKAAYISEPIVLALNELGHQFDAGRIVDVLKTIRRLFQYEADFVPIGHVGNIGAQTDLGKVPI